MGKLNVDANYLFQDVVKPKTQQNDVTLAEYDMIKKFRVIDKDSQEVVASIIEKEYRNYIYQKEMEKVQLTLFDLLENKHFEHSSSSTTELEVQNLLQQTSAHSNKIANSPSLYEVKAAHNDHIDENGELKKDLSILKRPD